jgi:hypothetical protein
MQNAKVFKAYKAEFTCALIGAIFTIHTFLFSMAGFDRGIDALAAFSVVFSLVAMILGFIGASQLNRNNKSGGGLVTAAGGLSVFAAIFIGVIMDDIGGYDDAAGALGFALFHALVAAALFLTGGIMALARKRPAAAGPAGWPYPGHFPGQPYTPPFYTSAPGAQTPYTPYPPYPPPPYGDYRPPAAPPGEPKE